MLIPCYNSMRFLPALFPKLYRLDPQPNLYVFAENNSSDNTLRLISKFHRPKKIIRLWFRPDAAILTGSRYEVIAHIRQLLLTEARNFDADYTFFLDSDVYPISEGLIDLLSLWDKDVVGGSYIRLFPEGPALATKWLHSHNPGLMQMKVIPLAPLEECWVTSAGCMCLSRRIVQDRRINFWPLLEGDFSEDFGYCEQARKHGYKVYLDGTAVLSHDVTHFRHVKPWSKKDGQYLPFRFAS